MNLNDEDRLPLACGSWAFQILIEALTRFVFICFR